MNPEDDDGKGSFKTEVLTERGKTRPPSTRAMRRARTMALSKQVARLMDLLGPHKEGAVQALVAGLSATRKIYYNGVCVDEVPDGLVRHKNAVAILEWLDGKPREFQMHVAAKFDDFPALVDKLNASPTFQALQNSGQKTVKAPEIAPTSPDP